MRLVGAGLGRTGTSSLRAALELLLDRCCYHMDVAIAHPEHFAFWRAAARGENVDWVRFFSQYGAAVDWPTAAFWPELSEAFPDALVLLSTRATPEVWWTSADATIFAGLRRPADRPSGPGVAWRLMWDELARNRFPVDTTDAEASKAAYLAHIERVRREVNPRRLIDWQPGDGWTPICRALNVPEPAVPFPHANSTGDFHAAGQQRLPECRLGSRLRTKSDARGAVAGE